MRNTISSVELVLLEGEKSEVDLESPFLCAVFVASGKGRVGREMFEVSLEEVLDLSFHVRKFLSREEDQFEWRTVDGTVQMLNVYRELDTIRAELSVLLEETTSLGLKFDTTETSLKRFGEELRSDVAKALDGSEEDLDRMQEELARKIVSIRSEGRHPYPKKGV